MDFLPFQSNLAMNKSTMKNRMKYFGVGMLLAFLAIQSFGQTPSLGLSMTGSLNFDPGNQGARPMVSLSGPRMGFVWQDRAMNAHEIKVTGFNVGVVGEEPEMFFCAVGFNYQYRQFFLRKKEPKIMPYILVDVGLSADYTKIFPSSIPTQFPFSAVNTYLSGGFGIGGRCALSEKVYFDIALPMTFTRLDMHLADSGDPTVITTNSFDWLGGFRGVRAEASFGFWLGQRKLKDTPEKTPKKNG